jgi:hypothetical protein
MNPRSLLSLCLACSAVGGCQTEAQLLASERGVALQAATRRGQFEMGCPQATGTVLSATMLQPLVWGGFERAEYTVGVEGCGLRKTYVVVCQLGSTACFAVAGR